MICTTPVDESQMISSSTGAKSMINQMDWKVRRIVTQLIIIQQIRLTGDIMSKKI